MISRWIYNLFFHKAEHINLLLSFTLIFSAITAGYTIAHFPYRILKFFEKPWIHFIIFFSLSFSSYYSSDNKYNIIHAIFDALIYTVILQFIKKMLDKINRNIKKNQTFSRENIVNLNIKYDNQGALVSGFLPTNEYSVRWQWVGNYLQVWAIKDDLTASSTPNEPFTLYIKRNINMLPI